MDDFADDGLRKTARDLATAVGAQANYIFKIWLVLITATAVLAFPDIEYGMVKLPFSLGKADKSKFDVVMLFIQSALIVAYCQGFTKVHQANNFSQEKLKRLGDKYREARGYYDFYRVDIVARPWPLIAGLVPQNGVLSYPLKILYFLLRLFILLTLFGLPLGGLFGLVSRLIETVGSYSWFIVVILFIIIFVAFSVYAALDQEVRFCWRLIKNWSDV